MITKYFKTAILMTSAFFLSLISCDDWVETDYPNNQINSTQVFVDVQTAQAALGGLYASMRDQSMLSGSSYGMGALLGCYTDELDSHINDVNGIREIYLNQHQPINTSIERFWDFSYKQIYEANAIINGLENSVNIPAEIKEVLLGEALLIRSIIYLNLHQLFGEIPYTTSLDYQYNMILSKMSKEELMHQLTLDLELAASKLSDNYRDAERIYPNRKVAELVLAKLHLLNEDWHSAEQLSLGIIQSADYQFHPDVATVFHKSGSHIMWQMPPRITNNATQEAILFNFTGAPVTYTLSDHIVNSFDEHDLRKANWIQNIAQNDLIWYKPYKYKNLNGANNNEYSIVFRLEEVYFILAESLAMQGRISEALPYLNATRQRAGLEMLDNLNGESFKNELLLERQKEFFSELGHRFFDLKRLGSLETLKERKANWKPFHNRWPIPQKELLLNSNLNPQNDGY